MAVYQDTIIVQSNGNRPSYHNVAGQVKEIIRKSGIRDGLCVVQSPHTTCSVIFEEYVHDTDFNGDEFLQVDLNRILDRIIPRERTENMEYRYPGPKHVDFLMSLDVHTQKWGASDWLCRIYLFYRLGPKPCAQ